ncbi:MAG: DPP IV N-terminal domain-containing protein [Chitinophagaceae bacterium]
MRKFLLLTSIALSSIVHAQKKSISYEQAFKGSPTGILQNTPAANKWIDDEHYTESRKDADGTVKTFLVEAKSGKASVYTVPDEAKPGNNLPMIYDAINVTASPDKRWAAYTKKDHNLYLMELASKKETKLTTDGNDSILNGYASWVYYEEILGRASHYRAFWWSADSKHISFMHFDEAQVPVFPIYWSNGQHGYLENQRYPKAGDKNPQVKIGIVSVDNNSTVWADFNAADDQYFGMPYWAPNGQFWVQWMNRGQDQLIVYNINLSNGSKTTVYEEKQSTWIDLDDNDRIEFLPSGNGFVLKSDKTGWRHLYLYDMSGKLIAPLTQGDYTTGDIFNIDEKAKLIYFSARKENSARWDLYSATLDGKKTTRLSAGDYSYSGMNLSPNNKYFVTSYSNINTPTTTVLVDNRGKLIREISNAKGASFNDYALPKKELVRVPSSDGLFQLPVLITYPVNFDPTKKYPVLVSIYGGPNAGTVYDQWRMLPTDIWWAQEGLIQVAFDNRSSGHFGKKGMNYIHRQLGKYEIEDFMACGKWLKQQPWVAANKLCITGGSFGGYMTCMALTYGASVFDYGIANSSVTDWQLYDSHYTERFMDSPKENPEGYKATAVMTYANQYKGLLRITHGTSDDNVHMQNTLQFINLLEDQKKHFELMIYPGERHGVGGAKGIFSRTESYSFYYKNLLEKPMPAAFWQ